MRRNIKGTGRMIRGAIGILIISAGWYYHSWWGTIGLVPLTEAIFGWCAFRQFCGNKDCDKN